MIGLAAALLVATLGSGETPRGGLQGTAQQNPDSKITITNVFWYSAVQWVPFTSQQPAETPVECVFFRNDSSVTATRVRFHFVYSSSANQKIHGDDVLDVKGKFSTGIAQETYPPKTVPGVSGKQCRTQYGLGDAALSAYVSDVDYADGTSWHLPSPPPAPSPSPSPSP